MGSGGEWWGGGGGGGDDVVSSLTVLFITAKLRPKLH